MEDRTFILWLFQLHSPYLALKIDGSIINEKEELIEYIGRVQTSNFLQDKLKLSH